MKVQKRPKEPNQTYLVWAINFTNLSQIWLLRLFGGDSGLKPLCSLSVSEVYPWRLLLHARTRHYWTTFSTWIQLTISQSCFWGEPDEVEEEPIQFIVPSSTTRFADCGRNCCIGILCLWHCFAMRKAFSSLVRRKSFSRTLTFWLLEYLFAKGRGCFVRSRRKRVYLLS